MPYYIVVERLQEEKAGLERRVIELERQIEGSMSRGARTMDTQTDQDDMDQSTGVSQLKKQIRELHDEMEGVESALFDERIESQDFKTKAEHQMQMQKETVEKLRALEIEAREKYEIQRASAEMLKDQLSLALAETDDLKGNLKEYQSQANTQKLMLEQKLEMVINTLKKERERFKQERADWLESFVGERLA